MFNRELLLGLLCLFSGVFSTQRLLIDKLRMEFFELEKEFWVLPANVPGDADLGNWELSLGKRFYEFDQKLKQMPDKYLLVLKLLGISTHFSFLYSELKTTDNNYEKFREYQKALIGQSLSKVTAEDIIDTISNGSETGMNESYEYIIIYDLIYYQQGNIGQGPFKMADVNFWCKNYEQSPQQAAYNLHNVFALSDLKAYIMAQFVILANIRRTIGKVTNLLTISTIKKNLGLARLTRKNYEKITIRKIERFKAALMHYYPRDVWKCDPEIFIKVIKPKEICSDGLYYSRGILKGDTTILPAIKFFQNLGETYDEFTRLLQGHIQNEEDMNPQRICINSCTDYCYTKSYGCYELKGNYCRNVPKCNGAIVGCYSIASDATICLADSHLRRYDYIKYGSGTLGKKHDCAAKKSVDIWTRSYPRCNYCMCLCDEHGPKSDRYINLRPVRADIKNNRVVTGLRLVKRNRLLHIQIQEGQLLPYGYINESTVRWKEVDDYKLTDKGVISRQDYFTLTYEHRTMALDDIEVTEEYHVITGVRFEVIDNRVHFAIHVNPFNWHQGTVEQNGKYYMPTNFSAGPEICVSTTDIPILTNKSSQRHISGHVVFTHTDFDKDAAQTTIPFIDTQEVINKPAVPLTGAGIYYKGAAGYGGFIAPRIRTYDFAKHITNLVPTYDWSDVSGDFPV